MIFVLYIIICVHSHIRAVLSASQFNTHINYYMYIKQLMYRVCYIVIITLFNAYTLAFCFCHFCYSLQLQIRLFLVSIGAFLYQDHYTSHRISCFEIFSVLVD